MRNIFLFILLLIILTGCTTNEENQDDYLEGIMRNVFVHELNEVEPEHLEQVNNWLANARQSGEDGQYYIYSFNDDSSDYMYSYVYGKGYSDYEVSFIYNRSDSKNKGKIHVTGLKGKSVEDTFVKIKSINDLSILFILSNDTLADKLND